MMKVQGLPVLVLCSCLLLPPLAAGQLPQGEQSEAAPLSLITETPDEGFELAVRLARRAVTTAQPNRDVLRAERPEYADDADDLIQVSQAVALYFRVVAEANDYWRE